MVQAASTRLNKQAEYVNSLNVFQFQMEILGQYGMTIENGAMKLQKPASIGEVVTFLPKGFDGCAELRSYYVSAFRGFSQPSRIKMS